MALSGLENSIDPDRRASRNDWLEQKAMRTAPTLNERGSSGQMRLPFNNLKENQAGEKGNNSAMLPIPICTENREAW